MDLKPDARLAIALKLKAAKIDGVRYGLLKNGTLIPETVIYKLFKIIPFAGKFAWPGLISQLLSNSVNCGLSL